MNVVHVKACLDISTKEVLKAESQRFPNCQARVGCSVIALVWTFDIIANAPKSVINQKLYHSGRKLNDDSPKIYF